MTDHPSSQKEQELSSVLKLLLLEVYASGSSAALPEAGTTDTNVAACSAAEPLALSLKRAIYAGEPDADTTKKVQAAALKRLRTSRAAE